MQGLCCITDSSYTLLPSMFQVQRAFSRTLVAPVYKTFLGFPPPNPRSTHRNRKIFKSYRRSTSRISALSSRVVCGILPVDPWAPNVDSQSIASQLFAVSLFPYLGFLYFITKSKSAPKVTLFGFYFLLAFVGATTKVHYGTSLSNVDWLHGGAESLLTLTNLFIVMGLREALRKKNHAKENMPEVISEIKDEKKLPPRTCRQRK